MSEDQIQIIAFYEFKDLGSVGDLVDLKETLKTLLRELGVRGTI